MYDSACHRDDIIAAFEELKSRFEHRRTNLWTAYLDATRDMPVRAYAGDEQECWSVLQAGLAGITAEERVLERDFEQRLAAIERSSSIAS